MSPYTITREKLIRASEWAMTRDVLLFDDTKRGKHVVVVCRPNRNNHTLVSTLERECTLIGRYRAQIGMLQQHLYQMMAEDCRLHGLLPEDRAALDTPPSDRHNRRLSDRITLAEAFERPKSDAAQAAPRGGARSVLLPDNESWSNQDLCLA